MPCPTVTTDPLTDHLTISCDATVEINLTDVQKQPELVVVRAITPSLSLSTAHSQREGD